ncbi:MAG: glycosyltransferase family 2 protein [Bacteroidales bacterium]|jgi:GT2 family glycosyltransferase|nr:glycosyltransferase family 2 protein [Bacteroidales bacterium]
MARTAVVILNWNGLGFLEQFLGRVVECTPPEEAVIWVADNGSSDGSPDWVRKNFGGVKVISLEKNYGYAGGYARALEKIDAEYYLLLNSDIEVTPGWLQPMTSYLDENADAAACQPKILSFSDRSLFEYAGAAGGFIDRYGYPFCRGRIFDTVERDNGQYDEVTDIFWASGACLMVRASAYREAGGLDSDFFAHMEEIDLCWRILNCGYRIVAVPSSVVYHVGGGTLKYDSPAKIYLNFRNNLFMLYKNLPQDRFRRTLLVRKMLDGLAGLVFLARLKPRCLAAVLKAHIHYYRARKRLRLQRRELIKKSCSDHRLSGLVMRKSIVYQYYFKGKRRFSDLSF